MRHPRRRSVAAVIASWACAIALLAAAPLALPATVAPAPAAAAADASDWNPGSIIDDAVFYDGAAMSAGRSRPSSMEGPFLSVGLHLPEGLSAEHR